MVAAATSHPYLLAVPFVLALIGMVTAAVIIDRRRRPPQRPVHSPRAERTPCRCGAPRNVDHILVSNNPAAPIIECPGFPVSHYSWRPRST